MKPVTVASLLGLAMTATIVRTAAAEMTMAVLLLAHALLQWVVPLVPLEGEDGARRH